MKLIKSGMAKKHHGKFGNQFMKMPSKKFWKNKKIIVTGHTGFTGSWLSMVLIFFGAKIYGISLKPNTKPSLFNLLNLRKKIKKNYFCDINNLNRMKKIFNKVKPDAVFHLAAQPLVIHSIQNPIDTFKTNILGTANVCEASRNLQKLKRLLIVTTDKCYENKNSKKIRFFNEDDPLGGNEPYSSSKASAEMVVNAYKNTFFKNKRIFITTARAGNIIGGGDWANDRLMSDIFRSLYENKKLTIRYPNSTRPWQHVLDVVNGYILLAESNNTGAWNFGPITKNSYRVIDLLKLVKKKNRRLNWLIRKKGQKNESINLNLNVKKSLKKLKWKPKWNLNKTIQNTYDWYSYFYNYKNIYGFTFKQIKEFYKK